VYAAAVVLRGGRTPAPLPTVATEPDLITIRWADGAESLLRLPPAAR
jgi:hypothetical protein